MWINFLFLIVKRSKEKIYWDGSGSICNFLNKSRHELNLPTPDIILMILFLILKIFTLREALPQKIIPWYLCCPYSEVVSGKCYWSSLVEYPHCSATSHRKQWEGSQYMPIWLGHSVSRGNKYGNLAFQVKGVLDLRQSGQQTPLHIREGTPHEQTRSCLTAIKSDRKTDLPTVCRSLHNCDFVLQLSRDKSSWAVCRERCWDCLMEKSRRLMWGGCQPEVVCWVKGAHGVRWWIIELNLACAVVCKAVRLLQLL
jgi:hypothetical protein